jgi:hypothetical protein
MRDEERGKGAGLHGSALSLFGKGNTSMSTATQPQTRPDHIILWEGRLINNELREDELQSLKDYARQEQFDLEAECQRQYGVPVDWVTSKQRNALLEQAISYRTKRLQEQGFHYHRCLDCGEVSGCLTKDCQKPEGIECRSCHEGYRPGEWNAFERRLAQKGLI